MLLRVAAVACHEPERLTVLAEQLHRRDQRAGAARELPVERKPPGNGKAAGVVV